MSTRNEKELHDLICQLARIPAPTGKEEKRGQFCLDWFHKNGLKQAFIDEAGNVIVEVKGSSSQVKDANSAYTVFMAHMDVVFPDETDLPLVEKDGIIHFPGIMDNTANLANLMMAARYLARCHKQEDERYLLFVCGVGEEGLGNLKGVRQICKSYKNRIKEFYALDLTLDQYTALAVGSLRYRVNIKTPGGHSFLNFGNPNANLLMSQFVCGFYQLSIPKAGHTTYNVGVQKGGTSVNTIAQEASVLLEMRSDCFESLDTLRKDFLAYVKKQQDQLPEDTELTLTCIGDRPCEKDVDVVARQKLFHRVEAVVEAVTGSKPAPISCSTDCNIPLSLGIPSVCIGTCIGAGAHTREEWAQTDSFIKGLEIAIRLGLAAILCEGSELK